MTRNIFPLILFFFLVGSLPLYADDTVVARVNGAAITVSDLEAAIDALIPRASYHGSVSEDRRSEFREQALQNLIDRELQYQDAVTKGMKPDRKHVKVRKQQIKDRFHSKNEYRAALEQAGLTEDQLQARVEKEVLVQAVIEQTVSDPSKMREQEVRDYYEKNREKFRQPETVRLRLISMKDEKKAREALAKVKTNEDFGSVAARLSEDDYRIRGGDIGYVHRGRVLPALEKAAFALKIGEISSLIRAEGLWFVIKVEDRKPERLLSYEESKDKLKQELEAKRAAELKEKWMAELLTKAKIEILIGKR